MAVSAKFLLFVCCAALGVVLSSASTVPTTASSDTTNDETTTAAATEADTTTAAATEADTTTAAATEAETTTTTAAETTTAPQPPFQCYDCNSGSRRVKYWHNSQCNESGYIDTNSYTASTCNGYCYSYVGLYPAGEVFRGCEENLGGNSPGTVGCHYQASLKRHLCLCGADGCQTSEDLTDLAESYYQQYNDTVQVIEWNNLAAN